MKSIYLCGPMSGCTYKECSDWRKYVARHLAPDIVPVSPMRGKKYLENEKEIRHAYEETIMGSARAITTRDRFDVMNCDMMLANFLNAPKVSIGSMIEFGWADVMRKPVILVMEPKGNYHEHPIVEQIAGFRVDTLDEAITLANAALSMSFARENQ